MATVEWNGDYTATLTIASGQTESDVLDLEHSSRTSWHAGESVMVRTPATLPETVTLYVSDTGPEGAFAPYESAGSMVTFTADRAKPVTHLIAAALKLVADSGVGADRVFGVKGSRGR